MRSEPRYPGDFLLFLVLVYIAIWPPIASLIQPYTKMNLEYLVGRPLCTFAGHNWADEDRYGTEPVCLNCGVER